MLKTVYICTYKGYKGYLLWTCICTWKQWTFILYLQKLWRTSAVESGEVLQ